MWRYVDYDGDNDQDLIVGAGIGRITAGIMHTMPMVGG